SDVMLQLYRTLGLFEGPNPVAAQVCHDCRAALNAALADPSNLALLATLLSEVKQRNSELLDRHLAGRDRLLELNSCRVDVAQALVADLQALEAASNPDEFLRQVFGSYGLDADTGAHDTRTVRPSDDMLLDAFPLIPDEG